MSASHRHTVLYQLLICLNHMTGLNHRLRFFKALHYSCFWHFFTRCITAVLSDIGFVRFLLSSTSGPQASSNFLKSHSRFWPQRGILHAIDDGYSFVDSAKSTLPSHILQTTKYYFITVVNLLQPQVRDERPPIIAVFLYNCIL